MKMNEMYFGITEEMKKYEPLLMEQEGKVAECEKAMEKIMAEQESAERRLKMLKGKFEALQKMKEAYESAFGLNSEEEVKAENKTETVKAEVEKKPERKGPVKQINWKHPKARLLQLDRNDTEIGNYCTQASAARHLDWDQSSISRFMKFSKEEQIRRKNFYFKWDI